MANPNNLTKWAKAFVSVGEQTAVLATPNGQLNIGLKVVSNKDLGIIVWDMIMPNGVVSKAHSRIVPNGKESIYTFFLLAPPVPPEHLEGALNAQIKTLDSELKHLQNILK